MGRSIIRFVLNPAMRVLAGVSACMVLWIVFGHSAVAQSWKTESGTAAFTSSVPFHEFTGRSDHLTGVISLPDSTVDFYLDLSTLDSGIGKRDKDMRLTLDVKQFPFAEFYGKLVTAFDLSASGPQAVRVEGIFTLHGISRESTYSGVLQREGDQLNLTASWELNLKDFEIVPPRLLIMKVDEIQKISINANLTRVN